MHSMDMAQSDVPPRGVGGWMELEDRDGISRDFPSVQNVRPGAREGAGGGSGCAPGH